MVKVEKQFTQHIKTSAMVLLIFLVAFLSYKDILRYFFTFEDSLLLIQKSKIDSFEDIVKIFTEPLFENLRFYRPISVLSFSLDYFVWKLNPFGYHLTNLILHVIVSTLVFFLIRILTKDHFKAFIGANIFAIHPILVENVPGMSTRQDIIATLFLVLCLIFFLKRTHDFSPISQRKSSFFLVLSILSYIFALGSKEVSIIIPLIVFAYLAVHNTNKINYRVYAFKRALPYIITTIIYLTWRVHVIGELSGGYSGWKITDSSNPILLKPVSIAIQYFLSLLYPVHVDHSYFSVNPFSKTLGELCYPHGICLVVALSVLFIIYSLIITIKRSLTDRKTLFFLIIWLLLPLVLFLSQLIFVRRYMYSSVIPFSAIVSIMLVEGFLFSFRSIKNIESNDILYRRSTIVNKINTFFSFIITILFSIYLLTYSPLLKNYKQWEHAFNIEKIIFLRLKEVVKELPDNTVIHLSNLPNQIYYENWITPTNIFYLWNIEIIKTWISLNYPSKHINIVPYYAHWKVKYPSDLDSLEVVEFQTTREEIDNVEIYNISIINNIPNSSVKPFPIVKTNYGAE